jgi:hypothetical protein
MPKESHLAKVSFNNLQIGIQNCQKISHWCLCNIMLNYNVRRAAVFSAWLVGADIFCIGVLVIGNGLDKNGGALV